MNEIQSSRFKDVAWFPKEETNCIVGGSGGIGGWLTLLLSRANFDVLLYDFDTYEEHNMSGQMVFRNDIGKLKVDVTRDFVNNFCDKNLETFCEKFTNESIGHHYMFSAFDNMLARKDMFNVWKDYIKGMDPEKEKDIVPIFIDGRLSLEQMQIFCVTPDKIHLYEEFLFSDEEVPELVCTLKQTTHSATMIASHMVGFFTNHITNCIAKDIVRKVPFEWEYFIPIDYLRSEL